MTSFQSVPHRCPVCNGTGKVPNTFYTEYFTPGASLVLGLTPCRSCAGTGIVWSASGWAGDASYHRIIASAIEEQAEKTEEDKA